MVIDKNGKLSGKNKDGKLIISTVNKILAIAAIL